MFKILKARNFNLLNEHVIDILSNYNILVAENNENKNIVESPNDLYDENVDMKVER